MKKRITAVLLVVAMLMGVLPVGVFAADEAPTSGTCGENLTWTLEDGVLTISGTGDMNNYYSTGAIPWYGNSKVIATVVIENGVTSIGHYAFIDCSSLTSITIPDGVTSIGDSAFYGCSSLTSAGPIGSGSSIEFGWKDAIPGCAFYGCSSLTSITIPDSVTSIGSDAFRYCSSLTSITIPNGVTSIGSSAFYGCAGLRSITVPDGIKSIYSSMFYGCTNLIDVEIPNSVTRIEACAFYNCTNLTKVELPNGLTYLGADVFHGTSITSIYIPKSLTLCGHRSVGVRGLYDSGPFTGATLLTTVEFENGIESIPSYILTASGYIPEDNSSTKSSISEIIIPNSVTSIGESAFYGCRALTDIYIPDSVRSISTVSYTHLDVYKRQDCRRSCSTTRAANGWRR